MKIFKEIAPLKAFLKDLRLKNKSIGLVPTMGALHKGHISLIEASKAENDITVSTIFVNPTQFNNSSDLLKYPRTLDKDTKMLQEVQCDVLFAPDTQEVYPQEVVLSFNFGQLEKVMEGKFRPGHFSGVGLIVSKLFNIVEPDNAYFGQKDWQQFAIINQLVMDLNVNVKLHAVPTLREPDGLAMSSRNQRLNEKERIKATVFFKALLAAKELLVQGGDFVAAKEKVQAIVEGEPGVKLEYFELADSKNLNLLQSVSNVDKPILCIAGYVGEVRLIDNMFI
ncbi:pantoate--beta-alanine ligase [Chryseosolibacter indicus]|uniref:Pantothenate synthetase n=1 Tax=Chryseosolibacter indicus TaxID=2782351 RepID=A0ABS5VPJ1_9BACT|nr:pantoate--beta-alanine ligase [Chryseosolibacter indicus]MBT1702712.1 pantoate--beta-alanine ligase [Chryseosolibacter indicus]